MLPREAVHKCTPPAIQVIRNKKDESIQATSVSLWSSSDARCWCFCRWRGQHDHPDPCVAVQPHSCTVHPDIFVRTCGNLLNCLSYSNSPLGSDHLLKSWFLTGITWLPITLLLVHQLFPNQTPHLLPHPCVFIVLKKH